MEISALLNSTTKTLFLVTNIRFVHQSKILLIFYPSPFQALQNTLTRKGQEIQENLF